ADVVQVVALVPVLVEVPGAAFGALDDVDELVVALAVVLAGEHCAGEGVEVTGLHRSVGAEVVVPVADGGDRDDGLQTLDAGRGHTGRQGADVRHTDQGAVTGRPVGVDRLGARLGRVGRAL